MGAISRALVWLGWGGRCDSEIHQMISLLSWHSLSFQCQLLLWDLRASPHPDLTSPCPDMSLEWAGYTIK